LDNTCYFLLLSYSDSTVIIKSWVSASHVPAFLEKLRSRLQQLEAWSDLQAHPYLDQRVFGILSLLAEQFGVATPQGRLVDVRITPPQLASAVRATRASITRTLGDIRNQNKLSIVTKSDGERFYLLHLEPGHHGIHTEEN
jgi:hypothetical protein